jgi:hypothetical protein
MDEAVQERANAGGLARARVGVAYEVRQPCGISPSPAHDPQTGMTCPS